MANIQIYGTLPSGGTTDYEELENKPSINNVELIGNKSLEDLGIPEASNVYTKTQIDTLFGTRGIGIINSEIYIGELDYGIYHVVDSPTLHVATGNSIPGVTEGILLVMESSETAKNFILFEKFISDSSHITIVRGNASINKHSGIWSFWLKSSDTYEPISNKVTSISSASTNTQYPTAKAVYDYVDTMITQAIGGSY